MAVSHAAAAAAGVTLGFAVGTLGFVVAKPKQPAIVGTFRREDDGSGVTGVLVYEACDANPNPNPTVSRPEPHSPLKDGVLHRRMVQGRAPGVQRVPPRSRGPRGDS